MLMQSETPDGEGYIVMNNCIFCHSLPQIAARSGGCPQWPDGRKSRIGSSPHSSLRQISPAKASRGESSISGACADTGISSTTTAPLSDGCVESSLVPRRQSY